MLPNNERLRAARVAMGLTQEQMADCMDLGRWGFQRIGCWERGVTRTPRHIVRLAELLVLTDQHAWDRYQHTLSHPRDSHQDARPASGASPGDPVPGEAGA